MSPREQLERENEEMSNRIKQMIAECEAMSDNTQRILDGSGVTFKTRPESRIAS